MVAPGRRGAKASQADPPSGGWKQWNANSAAAKALKEGLASEDIDCNATPKQVWESNPLFQQYKLDTFRHHLAKERAKQGIFVRDDSMDTKENGKKSTHSVISVDIVLTFCTLTDSNPQQW
jgi:hypothetical protein